MQLDNVSAAIRPRNNYEALDLGFVLIREYWRPVFASWFAIVLPLFVILNIVLKDNLFLAVVVFWWLKPFYDRIVLHILSRAMFGEVPGVRQTFSALPSIFKSGLLTNLTFYRIDVLLRTFKLPVWQLEGLRGKQRRARHAILGQRVHSTGVMLLFACSLMESILCFTIFGTAYLFLPEGYQSGLWAQFTNPDTATWFQLASNISYFIAVSIIEPLFAAAGFTLYINRRTLLEGWDIELIFRRMAARLARLASSTVTSFVITACLLLVSFNPLLSEPAHAEKNGPTPEVVASERLHAGHSREVIDAVLAQDEFQNIKKIKTWFPLREDETTNPDDVDLDAVGRFMNGVAQVSEALLWALAVFVVAMIIVHRDRWLPLLSASKRVRNDYQPPETLFGMDIRPQSLPDDIGAAARNLWQQGQAREALSLLYRGSLMVLVNREQLELLESHTEGDVLKLCKQHLDNMQSTYLARLTHNWQNIAYAHRTPAADEALTLCNDWQTYFGEPA